MVKNLSVTGAIVVAVVFGVLYFKGPAVITVPQITQLGSSQQASPIVNVEAAKPVVIPAPVVNVNVPKQEAPKLGSVASPDLPTPWFSFGGVSQWAGRMESLIQGSSTVCAIQAPASTSTLDHASIKFALATTSAVIVDIAKNSTKYSTTTKIGTTYNIPASAQATIVASTTGSVAGDATIFEPNYWLVIRMVGATVTSGGDVNNAPVGVCNARWTRI